MDVPTRTGTRRRQGWTLGSKARLLLAQATQRRFANVLRPVSGNRDRSDLTGSRSTARIGTKPGREYLRIISSGSEGGPLITHIKQSGESVWRALFERPRRPSS